MNKAHSDESLDWFKRAYRLWLLVGVPVALLFFVLAMVDVENASTKRQQLASMSTSGALPDRVLDIQIEYAAGSLEKERLEDDARLKFGIALLVILLPFFGVLARKAAVFVWTGERK